MYNSAFSLGTLLSFLYTSTDLVTFDGFDRICFFLSLMGQGRDQAHTGIFLVDTSVPMATIRDGPQLLLKSCTIYTNKKPLPTHLGFAKRTGTFGCTTSSNKKMCVAIKKSLTRNTSLTRRSKALMDYVALNCNHPWRSLCCSFFSFFYSMLQGAIVFT